MEHHDGIMDNERNNDGKADDVVDDEIPKDFTSPNVRVNAGKTGKWRYSTTSKRTQNEPKQSTSTNNRKQGRQWKGWLHLINKTRNKERKEVQLLSPWCAKGRKKYHIGCWILASRDNSELFFKPEESRTQVGSKEMRDGGLTTSSAEDIEYSKTISKKHQKWTTINVYLLHQNVESLQYKIGRVEEFLETLKEKPQIIGLTEHWFRAGEGDLAAVGGYHLVSAYSRGIKRNGGSCLSMYEMSQI
ncbi:hypothetical protein HHI36_000482 [Cryptolaemus montrouzieri]|uniref:Uncharacterized protein n=1 Tax=Cryptolaemus montrouzieri TaxID=559131 RepID=A0ABD2P5H9_9CUCU